ncbi:alpha/beta hydrolase [Candidatus Gottesmanbacteria bacterium]|nr:alpha/beta hydrolase [Candidatus Gottesmanbacteria bacterium]
MTELIMEQKLFLSTSSGDKLCGMLSQPKDMSSSVVLLVHGHSSNKKTENLVKISEFLTSRGVSTFRIDLYGHGESSGNFEDATISKAAESVLAAIEFLKGKGFTKIGLIGSSYGGIASIVAASRSKNLVALGLKSPVSNYADLYKNRLSREELQRWRETNTQAYPQVTGVDLNLRYSFFEDAIINDGYVTAVKIKVPVLIVHGDADIDVPISQSQKLVKQFANGKLEVIHGADHRYSNPAHAEKMRKLLSDFMLKYLA